MHSSHTAPCKTNFQNQRIFQQMILQSLYDQTDFCRLTYSLLQLCNSLHLYDTHDKDRMPSDTKTQHVKQTSSYTQSAETTMPTGQILQTVTIR